MSNKTEGDFKRPNHEDFMDSSELRKMEYSGVRHNAIGNCMEIWIRGEVTDSMSDLELQINPDAFKEMYRKRFCLDEVKIAGEPEKEQRILFS